MQLPKFAKLIIITGHFGSGKTNIAVNIARMLAEENNRTALLDFDIVNPYFRAADSADMLRAANVRCIIPEYANSNVDIPTLPADVQSVFYSDEYAIFDVGGDDMGATALSVYSRQISSMPYEMIYVCNMYRPLTSTPEETVEILHEIEIRSRLRCTSIVNNSNLGAETTPDVFLASVPYARRVCELAKLPLRFNSVIRKLGVRGDDILEIDDITKHIWS